jgi:hypothetical protein
MPTLEFALPTVESGRVYAPGSLAREILNLQITDEGTLRSVRGPAPVVPNYGAGYPWSGRMYGVFHAKLDSGMRDVTLVRTAGDLVELRGWRKDVVTLQSGLSQDPASKYPDQFCEVGGKIVWTNGVDAPLVYDGYRLLPLGYQRAPGTATPMGPTDNGHPVFTNAGGYSHPGKIGTPGESYDTGDGTLLAGAWYYWIQYEDAFGNLSPLSPACGPVTLRQERTANTYWANYSNYPATASASDLGRFAVRIDDLTRQFFLQGIPTGPDGTVARRVYRSRDAIRNPADPRLLVRIPDNETFCYPDNVRDGGLGEVGADLVSTPTFRIMCPYRGGLAIANTPASPGIVRLSEPGFAGTFSRSRFVFPDPNGAEVTGLANFGGRLLAFTESTVFAIVDEPGGLVAEPVTTGVGCVAPSSIRATGWGTLLWLGADGFYEMTPDGATSLASDAISPVFKRLNLAALSKSAAAWSPRTKEYLCAVPEAGSYGNGLVLVYDGKGWRKQRHGIRYVDICTTKDWRHYVLGAGIGDENNVFALDCEVRTYSLPTKQYAFRSAWLRPDATGRSRFRLRHVFVGFVEAHTGNVTATWYVNGRRDTAVASKTLTSMAPDRTDGALDAVTLGTTKLRSPRLVWKRIDIGVLDCDSFSFDLACSAPVDIHIAAFAFEFDIVGADGTRLATT